MAIIGWNSDEEWYERDYKIKPQTPEEIEKILIEMREQSERTLSQLRELASKNQPKQDKVIEKIIKEYCVDLDEHIKKKEV